MKRLFLTLIAAVTVTAATAQTKPKKQPVTLAPAKPDSVYTLSLKQVNEQIAALANLSYIIKNGTDNITPNQVKGALKFADSIVATQSKWAVDHTPAAKPQTPKP